MCAHTVLSCPAPLLGAAETGLCACMHECMYEHKHAFSMQLPLGAPPYPIPDFPLIFMVTLFLKEFNTSQWCSLCRTACLTSLVCTSSIQCIHIQLTPKFALIHQSADCTVNNHYFLLVGWNAPVPVQDRPVLGPGCCSPSGPGWHRKAPQHHAEPHQSS